MGTGKVAPWKNFPQKIAPTLNQTQTLTLMQEEFIGGGGAIFQGTIFQGAIFQSRYLVSSVNHGKVAFY